METYEKFSSEIDVKFPEMKEEGLKAFETWI